MSEKLELRARALDKALTLAAANKGETSAEQLIADAFVISAYLKGLQISVVSGDLQNNRGGLSIHDSDSGSPKADTPFRGAGFFCVFVGRINQVIKYVINKTFSGHLMDRHGSSSVLADGDSGDSVAAGLRNNGTPDTSEKGVNGDA